MAEVAAERKGKRFGGWWFEEKGRVEGFAMEARVPPIYTGSNTISYVATAISTLHPWRVNTHPIIYLQFLSPLSKLHRSFYRTNFLIYHVVLFYIFYIF